MLAYIIRRLFAIVPLVIAGLTLTFFVIHLAPGDPVSRFFNPSFSPEVKEKIVERFGLEAPLPVQYFNWLERVLFHADFGFSYNNGQPATKIILRALGPTLLLSFAALLFGLLVGLPTGMAAALKKDSLVDHSLTTVMLFFYSMPAFWLGLLLLSLFAIKLQWFPSAQLTSVWHEQLGFFEKTWDYATHLFLPMLTLGLSLAATFYRYIRSSLNDVLTTDYILAAKAQGITCSRIIFQYALRNAILPIISLLGILFPMLLSGTLIIEVIFSLPGMGRVMVSAALARDYPVILAASTLAFLTVIVGNFIADILYVIIDPRIKLSRH